MIENQLALDKLQQLTEPTTVSEEGFRRDAIAEILKLLNRERGQSDSQNQKRVHQLATTLAYLTGPLPTKTEVRRTA